MGHLIEPTQLDIGFCQGRVKQGSVAARSMNGNQMIGLKLCPADRGLGGEGMISARCQHERVFHQPVEDQVRVRRAHDIYAELHLTACHGLEAVGRGQVENTKADVGILLVELANDGRQEVECCGGESCHSYPPASIGTNVAYREQGTVEFLQHAPHKRNEFCSERRRRHMPGRSLQ